MTEAKIVYDNTKQAVSAINRARTIALTTAAIMVEGDATLRCPVDTGNLRGSLNHQVRGDTAKIGTNVEYAPFPEYGTNRMTAKPYLRPALDNNREKIKRLIAEQYKAALKGVTR